MDVHSVNESEAHAMSVLFGEADDDDGAPMRSPVVHDAKTTTSSFQSTKRSFEESFMIVLLFLVFSLPTVSDTIRRLPFVRDSFWMENVVKIVLILILYAILKTYCLQ